MIKTLLIANRGEIAARIIKTCQKLAIKTIAIYSQPDRFASYVTMADQALFLSGQTLAETYLNIDAIIHAAKRSGADAIHPGYGFLSENAAFSQACADNNLIFIGPSSDQIELMGCKKQAKVHMQQAGVPVTPGFAIEEDESIQNTLSKISTLGFPILLKAASGGGGKGMKQVDQPEALEQALNSAKREAKKSFANDNLIVEKYLTSPRHVEVQIFADSHGNVVHLFDRDCSIQRRHQKIIEEAPAPDLSSSLRAAMQTAAIKAAKAIQYCGAGTIEFLVENDQFYFMEMNTRLQVEHPVTEKITGIDLVEWQIHVANGLALPLSQEQIHSNGHAIEVRVYAEDPYQNFLPQTGTIEHCQWPIESDKVRVDAALKEGDEISINFDPMIAKLIGYGQTREQARQALSHAITNSYLTGICHNLDFLAAILEQQAFIKAKLNTQYLIQNPITPASNSELAALALASYLILIKTQKPQSAWQHDHGWRLNQTAKRHFIFQHQQQFIEFDLMQQTNTTFSSSIEGYPLIHAFIERDLLCIETQGQLHKITITPSSNGYDISLNHRVLHLHQPTQQFSHYQQTEGSLTAPMPGTIISVSCQENETVIAEQVLMIIEAMKMEHRITAPFDGKIEKIYFQVGDQANEGQELLAIAEIKE